MNLLRYIFYVSSIMLFAFTGCHKPQHMAYRITQNYKPDDQRLYDTIAKLDSIFFTYYNTCDINLEKYASFFSEDIEFYHDQGGLMTSKKAIVEGTQKFVCGKVTRTLVKGSLEVYPIKDFGAIELGLHQFRNNQESKDTPSKIGRFTILWEYRNNIWKIKRVVSLH